MATFNQTEVNSIREIVMAHQMSSAKLSDYANQCQDPQIREMFGKAAQESKTAAQNLIQML
ncbi:MAG: hypothetical protein LBM16_05540 [Clostridiales bacterium]|jgi:hypothetical protein|nr:hypothetical protein [Clostridiales bacterium]